MTLHQAKKLVIITEKLISKGVCEMIDAAGASGYTLTAAGGKGSRSMRSTNERASVVDDFRNVKIEVILADQALAEQLMQQVAAAYFDNYSGITYLEAVETVRTTKFQAAAKA